MPLSLFVPCEDAAAGVAVSVTWHRLPKAGLTLLASEGPWSTYLASDGALWRSDTEFWTLLAAPSPSPPAQHWDERGGADPIRDIRAALRAEEVRAQQQAVAARLDQRRSAALSERFHGWRNHPVLRSRMDVAFQRCSQAELHDFVYLCDEHGPLPNPQGRFGWEPLRIPRILAAMLGATFSPMREGGPSCLATLALGVDVYRPEGT